jgi:hypothetical protein
MKAGYDWIKNKEIQMLLEMALASVRLKTWARRRSPLTTRHKAGRWQQVGGGGLEWFKLLQLAVARGIRGRVFLGSH